jgi:hypothetical protein
LAALLQPTLDGVVESKAAYVALALDPDSEKDVLRLGAWALALTVLQPCC